MENLQAKKSKVIVIKVGSNILVNEKHTLRKKWLATLVDDVQKLQKKGSKVIIVSSGAIALGKKKLGLADNINLNQSQAAAARANERSKEKATANRSQGTTTTSHKQRGGLTPDGGRFNAFGLAFCIKDKTADPHKGGQAATDDLFGTHMTNRNMVEPPALPHINTCRSYGRVVCHHTMCPPPFGMKEYIHLFASSPFNILLLFHPQA